MSEVAKPESTARPDSDVSAFEPDSPARLPVPETAAASLPALILLVVGAIISVLLRRRPTTGR